MAKRKSDPTIQDVVEMLVSMDGRMQRGFDALNTRIDTIDERLTVVEQTVSKHSVMLAEIQEQLEYLTADVDHDSRTIRDHERRIKRLEQKSA